MSLKEQHAKSPLDARRNDLRTMFYGSIPLGPFTLAYSLTDGLKGPPIATLFLSLAITVLLAIPFWMIAEVLIRRLPTKVLLGTNPGNGRLSTRHFLAGAILTGLSSKSLFLVFSHQTADPNTLARLQANAFKLSLVALASLFLLRALVELIPPKHHESDATDSQA